MRNALLAGIIAFGLIALSTGAFASQSYYAKPWFIPAASVYYGGTYVSGYNPYYNYVYTSPGQTMHSSTYPGGYFVNTPYGTGFYADSYYSYPPAYSAYPVYSGYPAYSGYSGAYRGYSVGYAGNCFGSKCALNFSCYGYDC